jgi:hypothetical protein
MVGVVICPLSLWSEVVAAQVVELPPDLEGGKVEEMRNRLDAHILECPMKSHHRVLKDVVRGFPTPQVRITTKRPPGEPQQSLTRMLNEGLMG